MTRDAAPGIIEAVNVRLVVTLVLLALLGVALAQRSASPHPALARENDGGTRLRFRVDAGALPFVLQDLDGARALFGDVTEVRASLVEGAPDLTAWWTIETHAPEVLEALLVSRGATELSREPAFVPALVPALAPALVTPDGPSCPIQTPGYDARQGYRRAIDVDSAWNLPGGRGKGVSVADVEGEWNAQHEDLPTGRIQHVAGTRQPGNAWRAHGTAVLGVVAATDNGVGMLGLAPDVDRIVTASLGRIGPARAIYEAAMHLAPGDVLILELHGPGPNARGNGQKGYVPMEWWQPEFDAIRFATARGVIVIEAGGNGGENLDAPVYKKRFDRNVRDSGAIMVGAGAPETRTRLGFSNHGARLDVHGWGALVATLDYGDLQGCSAVSRKYTARFGGTSSASPVVAGAALAIQGAYKIARGRALTPPQMRALLVDTGTPQAGAGHIGPLPHVGRALAALAIVRASP